MIDETTVDALLRVLRAIDVEKDAAKADAKDHKERIDELLDDALVIREQLEGTGPSLFDQQADEDEEPARGGELVQQLKADKESEGEDAYEKGAKARRDGKAEADCPYEYGSYHGASWISGWREAELLPEEEDTNGPVQP